MRVVGVRVGPGAVATTEGFPSAFVTSGVGAAGFVTPGFVAAGFVTVSEVELRVGEDRVALGVVTSTGVIDGSEAATGARVGGLSEGDAGGTTKGVAAVCGGLSGESVGAAMREAEGIVTGPVFRSFSGYGAGVAAKTLGVDTAGSGALGFELSHHAIPPSAATAGSATSNTLFEKGFPFIDTPELVTDEGLTVSTRGVVAASTVLANSEDDFVREAVGPSLVAVPRAASACAASAAEENRRSRSRAVARLNHSSKPFGTSATLDGVGGASLQMANSSAASVCSSKGRRPVMHS